VEPAIPHVLTAVHRAVPRDPLVSKGCSFAWKEGRGERNKGRNDRVRRAVCDMS
jgi:hypothetical protein